jgi:2-phosphosulfolactate phosphatase
MEIEILEFTDGAKKARGVTVIIDVFRAFSAECYAYDSGVSKVIATGSADEAFILKKQYNKSVLAGEKDEKKIDGFDFGNSPTELIKADIQGKILIHNTTAGTNGLINAVNADMVLTGSLVNAFAVATYIKNLNPIHVSLVAMGYRASISTEEDLLCAEIISDYLRGIKIDYAARISDLRNTSGKRFFIPANLDFSPPTDFFLCTILNKFNFVLKAERRFDGNIDIMKIDL